MKYWFGFLQWLWRNTFFLNAFCSVTSRPRKAAGPRQAGSAWPEAAWGPLGCDGPATCLGHLLLAALRVLGWQCIVSWSVCAWHQLTCTCYLIARTRASSATEPVRRVWASGCDPASEHSGSPLLSGHSVVTDRSTVGASSRSLTEAQGMLWRLSYSSASILSSFSVEAQTHVWR